LLPKTERLRISGTQNAEFRVGKTSSGVRNQWLIFGRGAPLLCKTTLFGGICATVVQPEGYDGFE
jgi:hypothetical protein